MAEKYFWLKLQKDFFKRHDIKIIEAMENGKDYILFYLKLLCESVSHNGNLRFSDTIPYNDKMLSTITDTDIDKVRNAIKIFTELQMMEVLEDGTIYLAECQKMLGSETKWAEKKRLYRDKQRTMSLDCPQNVQALSQDVLQDIDIDKEKDIDNTMYVNNIKNKNESNNLSPVYVCTKERTEEERQLYKTRWSEFFKYCCTDKYVNASNSILDTIICTQDYFKENKYLRFNSKNYDSVDFYKVLTKIDDEKMRQITMTIANNENIEDMAGYVLGCLIKASEI